MTAPSRIGILSDTHGHLERTRQACKLLLSEKPDLIIHCGDLGSESVLIELATAFDPAAIPVHAVLGNVDLGDTDLLHFPTTTCVRVHQTAELEGIDRQRMFVAHGHDHRLLQDAINSRHYAYVFTGHTHVRSDKQVGATRVINPGAVYRASEPGCAVLDLTHGQLSYLDI